MTLRVIERDSKHADEVRQRGFDVTDYSTQFWYPGIVIPAGYRIRPAPAYMADALGYLPRYGPDGYEYVASIVGGAQLGQAGRREPAWSASPISDGSIIWTRTQLSVSSLFRTIAAPQNIEWVLDANGMEITNEASVVGVMLQVAANHGGGTEGEEYRVIARVPYSDGTIEDYAIDWTILDDRIA